MEKLDNMTDPAARTYEGADRILHVPFAASQIATRRGGKAVDLHHQYQMATANSSNLAGWLEMDAIGVTGGHPATVAAGDMLPVNFGLDKSAVMPTSGRVAASVDRGKRYDVVVDGNNVQYVNLAGTTHKVLTVEKILDTAGSWVSCSIPPDVRYGNL